jgi:hypothetical protein
MSFLILCEGGVPFRFHSEIITGHNPLLHPLDEFETHVAEVKQAKAECAAWNKRHFPSNTATKTQSKN